MFLSTLIFMSILMLGLFIIFALKGLFPKFRTGLLSFGIGAISLVIIVFLLRNILLTIMVTIILIGFLMIPNSKDEKNDYDY